MYYFRWSKLLDKSCQICQTRSLCTVWDISRATSGMLLWFNFDWKLDISSFLTIYGRLINSSRQERMICLKSWLKSAKNVWKLEIWATWRNFSIKTLLLLSYFIYLFIYFWIIFLIWVCLGLLDIVHVFISLLN
jgi:hypothetical protein